MPLTLKNFNSSFHLDAGIYHNPTLGLISVSDDGINWITISDKNAGATTVYNYGDTLTDDNRGKYYQWGNCYGFTYSSLYNKTSATTTSKFNSSGYGAGTFYSSSSYMTVDDSDLETPMNADLRGGITNTNAAKKGMCDTGFHIPTYSELESFASIVQKFVESGTLGDFMHRNLKIPPAGGFRYNREVAVPGTAVLYSCTRGKQNGSYYITTGFYGSSMSNFMAAPTTAYTIRPFANSVSIPDNTRTVISKKETTPGIYHNASKGLITLSADGKEWITIADKNLGATTVYNYGDTLSQANCGKYYQWGNNYGFDRANVTNKSTTPVNTSTYGPGNYYSSSTYIAKDYSIYTSVNGNQRGDTTNTDAARKGPSSASYHIPSAEEGATLVNILQTLGITTKTDASRYLKAPLAGNIQATSGSKVNTGAYTRWHTTKQNNTNYVTDIAFSGSGDGTIKIEPQTSIGAAKSIREFKNDPVLPDETRTVLYQSQPAYITTPGIYYNADLGVISISADGNNWTTIADKNVGATSVRSDGLTKSESNCGKLFQYGNNNGFAWTGSISTSSTQVNASGYGPGTYYSGATFITTNPWDSSGNKDLRGNVSNTLEARRGPCNEGYHIPLLSERQTLYDAGVTIGAWSSSILTTFSTLLKLPFASFRGESGSRSSERLIYRASTTTRLSIQFPDMWLQSSTSNEPSAYHQRQNWGVPIRPFKNIPIKPSSSRTVIYQQS